MRPALRPTILAVACAAVLALAGCVSNDPPATAMPEPVEATPPSPFEAALAQTHHGVSDQEGSTITLGLMTPKQLADLEEGAQDVVFVLYDSTTKTAITDAQLEINARMPAMGHGTAPEEDPVHQSDGVYKALTTWTMPGGWVINILGERADGTPLTFAIDVTVGPAQTDPEPPSRATRDDGHSDAMFPSFAAAKDAHGPEHEAYEGSSPLRLKVVKPHMTNARPTGPQDLAFLVYDAATDEPVREAEVKLRSYMPEHGHGTSSETQPTYDAHGVYKAKTNHFMAGDWEVRLTVTQADGTATEFRPMFNVTDGSDSDAGDHSMHGNESGHGAHGNESGHGG